MALDLGGAVPDPLQPGVAPQALDRDLLHESHAAVNLHGAVGSPVQRADYDPLGRWHKSESPRTLRPRRTSSPGSSEYPYKTSEHSPSTYCCKAGHWCPNKAIEWICNVMFLLEKYAFSTGHRFERRQTSAGIVSAPLNQQIYDGQNSDDVDETACMQGNPWCHLIFEK